jgi:hypothetical protein
VLLIDHLADYRDHSNGVPEPKAKRSSLDLTRLESETPRGGMLQASRNGSPMPTASR